MERPQRVEAQVRRKQDLDVVKEYGLAGVSFNDLGQQPLDREAALRAWQLEQRLGKLEVHIDDRGTMDLGELLECGCLPRSWNAYKEDQAVVKDGNLAASLQEPVGHDSHDRAPSHFIISRLPSVRDAR